MKLNLLRTGGRVTHKLGDIGRIKRVGPKYAFVVFNCDHQWKNYKDYTAVRCEVEELTPEWNMHKYLKDKTLLSVRGNRVKLLHDNLNSWKVERWILQGYNKLEVYLEYGVLLLDAISKGYVLKYEEDFDNLYYSYAGQDLTDYLLEICEKPLDFRGEIINNKHRIKTNYEKLQQSL